MTERWYDDYGVLDYPMVCRRLHRWGFLGHLLMANLQRIPQAQAVHDIRRICGPTTRVRFRPGGRRSSASRLYGIALACDARIASVLHEAAHVLCFPFCEQPHGLRFCRIYMRLLGEEAGPLRVTPDMPDWLTSVIEYEVERLDALVKGAAR